MGDKIEKEFSRNEFAEYLEALAGRLRGGKISSAKGVWTVPEEFGGKIQTKEKKGRIELKISCRWSTLEDYTEQDREQISNWHHSMTAVKKRMGSSLVLLAQKASQSLMMAFLPTVSPVGLTQAQKSVLIFTSRSGLTS